MYSIPPQPMTGVMEEMRSTQLPGQCHSKNIEQFSVGAPLTISVIYVTFLAIQLLSDPPCSRLHNLKSRVVSHALSAHIGVDGLLSTCMRPFCPRCLYPFQHMADTDYWAMMAWYVALMDIAPLNSNLVHLKLSSCH